MFVNYNDMNDEIKLEEKPKDLVKGIYGGRLPLTMNMSVNLNISLFGLY